MCPAVADSRCCHFCRNRGRGQGEREGRVESSSRGIFSLLSHNVLAIRRKPRTHTPENSLFKRFTASPHPSSNKKISMQLSNAKPSLAGAAHSSASCSAKIMRGVCSRPVANVAARASAGGEGVTSSGQASARKLFQQHRVLLDSGFTYDQAALILQVSQQRTGLAGTRGGRQCGFEPRQTASWGVHAYATRQVVLWMACIQCSQAWLYACMPNLCSNCSNPQQPACHAALDSRAHTLLPLPAIFNKQKVHSMTSQHQPHCRCALPAPLLVSSGCVLVCRP